MGCGSSIQGPLLDFEPASTTLIGNFRRQRSRTELDGLSSALLDEQYRNVQRLELSFSDWSVFGIPAIATSLPSFAAITAVSLSFAHCKHLSDVSAIGAALVSLKTLQRLDLNFSHCSKLVDISVSVSLGSSTMHQLSQLSDARQLFGKKPAALIVGQKRFDGFE